MEETGGLAYGPHLPFKDGFMAHLLVLEMLAQTGKTLSVLYQDLSKKYGKYYYDRVDFRCDSEEEIKQWLSVSLWEKCLSEKVVSHDELDGEKWYFESGSWVLIRRSKTEPLLRIYFESRNLKFVKKIKELLNS
ncbi:MAG: hypothetical protein IPJ69_11370 [Deltaproteobacteria bacterium]|nr:MAG: hypothetical protein IPJ69_11370 [Deltaproteobacteria bacterium]